MPDLSPSLETERGSSGPSGSLVTSNFLQTWRENVEETPELRWPNNIAVYDRMRRQDGQVASGLRVYSHPVIRTPVDLADDGCDPRVTAFVRRNIGLELGERGRHRRRREGVVWTDLLRLALLMLPFGHSIGEQVYTIGPPPPDLEGLPSTVAQLRKVGHRLPRTIARWDIARDGGLNGVWQWVERNAEQRRRSGLLGTAASGAAGWDEVHLPIDRLVVWTNEREGSDWAGQSLLRQAYKHWLIKDTLLRLGPIALERSMGLLVGQYDPSQEDSAAQVDKVLAGLRTGENQRATLPVGNSVELLGVKGQIRDELPLVKYHDEAIGRSMLAMLLNLGHDRGARSLGDTFLDVFLLALQSIVEYIEEVVTEHLIRDLVEINFGEDEPYPVLRFDDVSSRPELAAESLAALVKQGVILADEPLEQHVRKRYGLPGIPGVGEDGVSTDGAPGDVEPVGGVLPEPTAPEPVAAGRAVRRPHGSNEREAVLDELARRLANAQRTVEARRRGGEVA